MPKKNTVKMEKELFEFILENTITYWLDMLPQFMANKCLECDETLDWYFALNKAFSNKDQPDFKSMTPIVIKHFLIETVVNKIWHPNHLKSIYDKKYENMKTDFQKQNPDIYMSNYYDACDKK
jgi:hypothetical protein